MLKIAVCDDEKVYLHDLTRLLEEYRTERMQNTLNVKTYSHPFDLAKAAENGADFDLFLLDIYMPGMTGIALAQELRKNSISTPIIFLTASADHALEAFGVGATQYLLKPFEKAAFFSAVDEAIEKTGKERRRQIVFKTEDGYRSMNVRDILYAEAHDKNQEIFLKDRSCLTVRKSSAELFAQLSEYPDFARCGAAYILNLAHIHTLDKKFAVMKNGVSIKIPRGAYPALKEKFLAFFYERG